MGFINVSQNQHRLKRISPLTMCFIISPTFAMLVNFRPVKVSVFTDLRKIAIFLNSATSLLIF